MLLIFLSNLGMGGGGTPGVTDTHDGGRDYSRRGRDRDREFKRQVERRRGLRDELVALYTDVRDAALDRHDDDLADAAATVVAPYAPTSAPDLPVPTLVDWDGIITASERRDVANRLKLLSTRIGAMEREDLLFDGRAALLLLLMP